MCSEYKLPVVVLAVALIWLASCSVREERDPCPRFLEVDLSAREEARLMEDGFAEVSWCLDYLSGSVEGTIKLDGIPDTLHLEIPVGEEAFFSACCSDGGSVSPGRGLSIRPGEACPELMTYGSLIDLADKEPDRHLILHKNHAAVVIELRDDYQSGCEYAVRGNVCGYSGRWLPEAGEFEARLSPDAYGRCRIVVPRQVDGSLKLCVYASGVMERAFSLGEFILDSGYDWNAEDLEDIAISVDYTHTSASFTVDQWKKTIVFSIVV